MIDSLIATVLISVLGTASFSDPNPITPQNERLVEFEQRAQYALDHYSEFGKLDDRGITYVRLGQPDWMTKGSEPTADLDLSLSQGKPPEYVETETWFYGYLKQPLVFQEREAGGFSLPRQPDQLVIFTSQVQPEINYEYSYDKDLLHCNYASQVYNLKNCPDSVELSLYLIIPPQELDTSYLWQVAIQDREGRVVRRDSSSDGVLLADGSIIDQLSLYLAKETFQGNTLTAHTYRLTTQVESGDKGNLQIWK